MSQEHVDLVRRALEAYQRRDARALHAISHEECELFTLTEGVTEGEPFRGHAGIDQWLVQEMEPWDEFRIDAAEITEIGDRVLLRYRVTARGRGSAVELNADAGSVFEFREGAIFRLRAYLDWRRALEAASHGRPPGNDA